MAMSATVNPREIEHVAAALRSHNIEAIVVDTGVEGARTSCLASSPEGAEVHWGKSKTLDEIGLYAELAESGRFDALRPRMFQMDRTTQGREIRKMIAAPDYMVGSVAAITEDGTLVAASATGSQLGALRVRCRSTDPGRGQSEDRARLEAALRRIDQHVFPWEDAQVVSAWPSTRSSRRSCSSIASGPPAAAGPPS